MAETVKFQVMTTNGTEHAVEVAPDATVADLRGGLDIDVPLASRLNLVQEEAVLLDEQPVAELDPSKLIYAVFERMSDLKTLLQVIGHYDGYKEVVAQGAASEPSEQTKLDFGEFPSILDVLEDMAGEPVAMENLVRGTPGVLVFSGEEGDLLLPNIDLGPVLKAKGVGQLSHVVISVGINSDAYNYGLGAAFEAHESLPAESDVRGLGLQDCLLRDSGSSIGRARNTIKFHPGMWGGLLRVQGEGGFTNTGMGWTPASWTPSGNKLHRLEVTFGANGENRVRLRGCDENQDWAKTWNHQLFDGRHVPAVYAWLDCGGGGHPLYVGPISLYAHLPIEAAPEPVESISPPVSLAQP